MRANLVRGFLTLMLVPLGCVAAEPKDDGHHFDCLGLLPAVTGSADEGPSELLAGFRKGLTPDESKLLGRGGDGKWRRFSDDMIEFELPDDPLLKVEMLKPEDKPDLAILFNAVGSTDKSFERVYRLTFGKGRSYGLVFVADKKWFDEGICLCGEVELKGFSLAAGNLLELSLLADGAIKKVQVLNDERRAVLFEWTHSAITQAAYTRIGGSLRLKPASKRTREEWIAYTKAQRGSEAGLGWLKIGTPAAEVEALLGPPTEVTETELSYTKERRASDGDGWQTTIRLPLQNGRLARFEEGWRTLKKLDAPRGTRDWMEHRLGEWNRAQEKLKPGEHPPLPRDEVALMLDAFHREAPLAKDWDWEFWCGVLSHLAELGVTDQKAVNLVVKRFAEPDQPQFSARWVLDRYAVPWRLRLIQDRLALLMHDPRLRARFAVESGNEELNNLFASLRPGDRRSEALIREGLIHQDETIRWRSTGFLEKLPRDEARKLQRERLVDPSEHVRRAAIGNVVQLCEVEDVGWLSKIAEQESVERLRDQLESSIGWLQGKRCEDP